MRKLFIIIFLIALCLFIFIVIYNNKDTINKIINDKIFISSFIISLIQLILLFFIKRNRKDVFYIKLEELNPIFAINYLLLSILLISLLEGLYKNILGCIIFVSIFLLFYIKELTENIKIDNDILYIKCISWKQRQVKINNINKIYYTFNDMGENALSVFQIITNDFDIYNIRTTFENINNLFLRIKNINNKIDVNLENYNKFEVKTGKIINFIIIKMLFSLWLLTNGNIQIIEYIIKN
jgi:hypothetical protein